MPCKKKTKAFPFVFLVHVMCVCCKKKGLFVVVAVKITGNLLLWNTSCAQEIMPTEIHGPSAVLKRGAVDTKKCWFKSVLDASCGNQNEYNKNTQKKKFWGPNSQKKKISGTKIFVKKKYSKKKFWLSQTQTGASGFMKNSRNWRLLETPCLSILQNFGNLKLRTFPVSAAGLIWVLTLYFPQKKFPTSSWGVGDGGPSSVRIVIESCEISIIVASGRNKIFLFVCCFKKKKTTKMLKSLTREMLLCSPLQVLESGCGLNPDEITARVKKTITGVFFEKT